MWGLPLVGAAFEGIASSRASAKQMEFAERMSGTAWQRAVADMRAAGINPMLAFMQGPASSPTSQVPNPLEGLSQAASSAVGLKQQMQLNKAQVELMGSQKDAQDAAAAQGTAQAIATFHEDQRRQADYNWEWRFRNQGMFQAPDESGKMVQHDSYFAEEYKARVNKFREQGWSLKESIAAVELLNMSKAPAEWDEMKAKQLLKMFQGSDAKERLALLMIFLNQNLGTAANLAGRLMSSRIPKWR